ncbi:MAG: M1 family metallopeptidase [bacterium]|nr:M1 family metallopeptidase [bacterium]
MRETMRLNPLPRPESYDLHVTVDPRRDRFDGVVGITLSGAAGLRSIELHAVDLDFDQTQVEDQQGPIPVTAVKTDEKRETSTLKLSRAIESDDASIHIAFEGPLRSDLRGLYLALSGSRRYAATQLEAADARRFFPCFDEPDKKARFRIRVTTPQKNSIVSNGPAIKTQRHGKLKTVTFGETPRLSTYLIALVVGEMEASRSKMCGDTPIRVWSVPGKKHLAGFALNAAFESLVRLEKFFGLKYPYDKLDLIAVPDFEFGAMENAGAVTFRESLLLVDSKTITLAEKKRVAEVIAHELAHMWYGDLVTMAWWDDLWLNEAFATWMAFYVVDDWMPEWNMWLDFEQHRGPAYTMDAMKNTHPIYVDVSTPDEATENFDLITYEKGASVVRMVERWLGSVAFRKGVRTYIRRHREDNAQAADLWRALEEASGENVEKIVGAWVKESGFPLVSVRLGERRGRAVLKTHQELFLADPRRPESARRSTRPIPVVLRVRPVRGRTKLAQGLLDRTRNEIDVGAANEVKWVYANADEAGFYHPVHHPDLLQDIGAELKRLSAVERMGLLGHQWACVCADRGDFASILSLIERLGDEEEPDVLAAIGTPLSWLDGQALPELSASTAAEHREWTGRIFRAAFDALGWRPRRGETDALRQRRATLLGFLGGLAEDKDILAQVQKCIGPYLKERSTLDANLAGPVVDLAARSGNKTLYDKYLRQMKKARTPQERTRFEMALASFRDPALVERTLTLSLSDDVPMQDVVPLLMRLLANPRARETTWAFIRKRWTQLAPRVSPGLAPRLVTATSALQTPAYKKEVAEFFNAQKLPTTKRALKQALERFDLNANLRRRAVRELRQWIPNSGGR